MTMQHIADTAEVLALVSIGGVCTWAVFSRHYDDPLMQRIGLSGLATACFLRAAERMVLPHAIDTPVLVLAAIVFVAMFAVGSAMRIVQSSYDNRPNRRVSCVCSPTKNTMFRRGSTRPGELSDR